MNAFLQVAKSATRAEFRQPAYLPRVLPALEEGSTGIPTQLVYGVSSGTAIPMNDRLGGALVRFELAARWLSYAQSDNIATSSSTGSASESQSYFAARLRGAKEEAVKARRKCAAALLRSWLNVTDVEEAEQKADLETTKVRLNADRVASRKLYP